jgi:agmatinase
MAEDFNPNNPGTSDSNIFALPYTAEESDLVLLPVPWEATVSYGAGTANGPSAILEASKQIDLFHPLLNKVWLNKMAMCHVPLDLESKSNEARAKAENIINMIINEVDVNPALLEEVNDASKGMIAWVKAEAQKYIAQGKTVALVGGDHSTPLGLLQALAEKYKFGILQIDAHCDLRNAYEGFEFSHASIMYNALKTENIQSLTQVGIRDYCDEEVQYINNSNGRVTTFFDRDIQFSKIDGTGWAKICDKIIATLPENVYVSFDIDGLTPDHCPNTGTPVPGGLSFAEVSYLLEKVAQQRNIISFDLNEVSPGDDDWDANVGARVLFQLCCSYLISKKK